jgi:hypothetical protein
MLRVLVLAPGSNPDGITGPLIGYSHAWPSGFSQAEKQQEWIFNSETCIDSCPSEVLFVCSY